VDDARLYGAVAEELEQGRVRKDLWSRALIESCGDEPAAYELYVRLCAEQLGIERAEASSAHDQTPETVPEPMPEQEPEQAPATTPEPAPESLVAEDAEQDAPAATGPDEEIADEVAIAPSPVATTLPQWTPHKPGLAPGTVIMLVIGGAALIGALGLAIAGFEGAGLLVGVAALVLLGSGFSRVSKSDHYRGPLD
jgi:hypothetical protein